MGNDAVQQRRLPCPLTTYQLCQDKEIWPKWKNRAKLQKRELSDEEVANLSDGEFKALVIKMLTELIELGQKMKEQMKDTQNEIKQNI